MTLWTVDRQHMHRTTAVFMTQQCRNAVTLRILTAAVPGICQSPGRPRFIFRVAHFELCFSYSISYLFARLDPFLRNII